MLTTTKITFLLEMVTFDTVAWGAVCDLAGPYDITTVKKTVAVATSRVLACHSTPLECMQLTFPSLHPLNHTCHQKAVYTNN